jgi:hypothetical protein
VATQLQLTNISYRIDHARNEFPLEDGNTSKLLEACSVINQRLRRKRAKAVSKFGKAILFACLVFMDTFTMPSLQEMWVDQTDNLNLVSIIIKRGFIPPYRHVFFFIDAVFN